MAGIERVEWILKDHLQRADGIRASACHRQPAEFQSRKVDRSGISLNQTHQNPRERGLAATGFADDCDSLPAPRIERQPVVCGDVAVALGELFDLEYDLTEACRGAARCGRRRRIPGDFIDSQAAGRMAVRRGEGCAARSEKAARRPGAERWRLTRDRYQRAAVLVGARHRHRREQSASVRMPYAAEYVR